MRNKYFLISALTAALMLTATIALAFDMTVVHVNDTHSYLESTGDKLKPGGEKTYVREGGWTRLTTAVKILRARKSNVALLHAGDAVQGDLYFMRYGGKPEMEFMNRLEFDAMTLGNHEFDKGPDFLAGLLGYTKFPVVSANINASGKPELAKHIKPYTILKYGEEQVGVIGLTIKDTAFVSSPGPKVKFMDEAATARKYVAELEAMGINKIILLTHVGLDNDKKLAATVAGVDVIVGGHSHSLIGDPEAMGALGKKVEGPYPVKVKGTDGNDVYVVTAWKWGRVLPSLDITFDDAGRVTSIKGNAPIILTDSFKRKNAQKKKMEIEGEARAEVLDIIAKSPAAQVVPANPDAVSFLVPYKAGVEQMRNDVIGEAAKDLFHIRVPGVDDDGHDLKKGSLLAPIVCDSLLWRINSTGQHADIAFMNAGGIRKGLNQGKVTIGDVYTLMPFANTLYLLPVTGKQVKEALETGVTRGSGAFPYTGGARYTADMNRPEGDRVTRIEVLGKNGKWSKINPSKTYKLVTNSYVAGGGDGYEVFKPISTADHDTGFVDALTFIKYVEKEKVLKVPSSTGVTFIPAK